MDRAYPFTWYVAVNSIARLLDIRGSFSDLRSESPSDAMRRDWLSTGENLRTAMTEAEDGLEISVRAQVSEKLAKAAS